VQGLGYRVHGLGFRVQGQYMAFQSATAGNDDFAAVDAAKTAGANAGRVRHDVLHVATWKVLELGSRVKGLGF
jgi:hypothetical protein